MQNPHGLKLNYSSVSLSRNQIACSKEAPFSSNRWSIACQKDTSISDYRWSLNFKMLDFSRRPFSGRERTKNIPRRVISCSFLQWSSVCGEKRMWKMQTWEWKAPLGMRAVEQQPEVKSICRVQSVEGTSSQACICHVSLTVLDSDT